MSFINNITSAAARGGRDLEVEAEDKPSLITDVLKAPFRGVEGAAQGVYNLVDFATFDALPDYDQRFLGESETMVGGFVEGTSQFLTGFIPVAGALSKAGKVSRLAKAGKKSKELAKKAKMRRLSTDIAAGTITDFTVFDGQEERLSNLIESIPALKNPVTEFLEADVDDNEAFGRLKNSTEGLFIEAGVRGLFSGFASGIRGMKRVREARAAENPEEAMLGVYKSALRDFEEAQAKGEVVGDDDAFRSFTNQTIEGSGTGQPTLKESIMLWTQSEAGQNSRFRPVFEAILKTNPRTLDNNRFLGFDDLPENVGGVYDPKAGTIKLRRKRLLQSGKSLEQTFLHEVVHSVASSHTAREFNFSRVDGTATEIFKSQLDQILAKLPTMNDGALKGITEVYLDTVLGKGVRNYDNFDDVISALKARREAGLSTYGLSNIDEFIAESLSNPQFFKQIDGVSNATHETLYRRMINFVRELIGIPKNFNSSFEDVIRGSYGLFRQTEAAGKTGNYLDRQRFDMDNEKDLWFESELVRDVADDDVIFGAPNPSLLYRGGQFAEVDPRGMQIRTAEEEVDPNFGMDTGVDPSNILVNTSDEALGALAKEKLEFSELAKVRDLDLPAIEFNEPSTAAEFKELFLESQKITAEQAELRATPVKFTKVEDGYSFSLPEAPKFNFKSVKEGKEYVLYFDNRKTQHSAKTRKELVSTIRDMVERDPTILDRGRDRARGQIPETAVTGEKSIAEKIKAIDYVIAMKRKDILTEAQKLVMDASPSRKLQRVFEIQKTSDGRLVTDTMRYRAAIRVIREEMSALPAGSELRKPRAEALAALTTKYRDAYDMLVSSKMEFLNKNLQTSSKNQAKLDAVKGGVNERLENFDKIHDSVTHRVLINDKVEVRKEGQFKPVQRTRRLEGIKSPAERAADPKDPESEAFGLAGMGKEHAEAIARHAANERRLLKEYEEFTGFGEDPISFGTFAEARMEATGMSRREFEEDFIRQQHRESMQMNEHEYDVLFSKENLDDDFFEGGIGGEGRQRGRERLINEQGATTEALENILKYVSSTSGMVHVLRNLVEDLDTVPAKALPATDITQTTDDLIDAFGGKKEVFDALTRQLSKTPSAMQKFRQEQSAIKIMMDTLATSIQKKAIDIQKKGEINITDAEKVEFLEDMDRLYEIGRLWTMYGREASLSLYQRSPLLQGDGLKTLENKVRQGQNNRDVGSRMPTEEARARYLAQKISRKKRFGEFVEEVATATNSQHLANGGEISAKVAAKIAKQTHGSKMMDMVLEYWTNSLLYAPTTQTVNIIGNMLTFGLRTAEIVGGSALTGNFQLAQSALGAAFSFDMFREAIRFAAMSAARDDSILTAGAKPFDDDYIAMPKITASNVNDVLPVNINEAGAVAGSIDFLGKYARLPSRFLGAGDEFFKQLNYRWYVKTMLGYEGATKKDLKGEALTRYVKDNFDGMFIEGRAYNQENVDMEWYNANVKERLDSGKLTPIEANREYEEYATNRAKVDPEGDRSILAEKALQYAKENTFTEELDGTSVFGVLSRHINELKRDKATRPISFLVPFVRTPTNILKFAVDRTPVGRESRAVLGDGFKAVAKLANIQSEFKSKVFSNDPVARADAMGKLSTSVMAVSLGWYLATNSEMFTGAGPKDADRRRALQMGGWQPYSIKIGDKYVSYNKLDPFSTILGLYVDMAEAYKYYDVDDDAIEYGLGIMMLSFVNNIGNKSFLQGIDNVMQIMSDPLRATGKTAADIAAGFVPNYFTAFANMQQTRELKEVRTWMDALVKRATPTSDELMPKRNVLGEKIMIENMDYGLSSVVPLYMRSVSDDPLNSEIARLNKGFSLPKSKLMNEIDLRKVRNEKGQTAYDRYQELTGETKFRDKTLRQSLNALTKSRFYKGLNEGTDEELDLGIQPPRVKAMQRLISQYRNLAKHQLLKEFPELQEATQDLLARRRRI